MDARVFFCVFDFPLFGWIDKYVFVWDERCHVVCSIHVSVCVCLEYKCLDIFKLG